MTLIWLPSASVSTATANLKPGVNGHGGETKTPPARIGRSLPGALPGF